MPHPFDRAAESRARRLTVASLGAAVFLLMALLAQPAYAAGPASDKLKRAGETASPSVVLVNFKASGYLNDNRDGKSYGPFRFSQWGTGFFVSSDGFIVTAAHVAAMTNDQIKNHFVESYLVQDANRVGCQARGNCQQLIDTYRKGYQVATTLSNMTSSISVYTQDMNAASQDTTGLPAELKTSSPLGQRDIAVLKINGENEPVLQVGDASKVQTQDRISIIGYPGLADTSAQTLLVPTVTTGTITAKKQGSQDIGLAPGVSIFQTDATVEHGNSGGPAINDDDQVVGLVSFGPSSTTNFLITSSDIRDLVQQAGARNTLGPIDKLWRNGLDYFDQHRYAKAKAAFDQCTAMNKVQVGCVEMSKKAASLLGQDEESKYAPKSSFPVGLVVGLGLLALLAVGGVGLALALTRRRRPQVVGAPAAYSAAPAVAQPQQPGAWQQPPVQQLPGGQAPPPPHQPSEPPPGGAGSPGGASNPAAFVPPAAPSQSEQAAGHNFCSFCGNRLTPGQTTCSRCGYAQ